MRKAKVCLYIYAVSSSSISLSSEISSTLSGIARRGWLIGVNDEGVLSDGGAGGAGV